MTRNKHKERFIIGAATTVVTIMVWVFIAAILHGGEDASGLESQKALVVSALLIVGLITISYTVGYIIIDLPDQLKEWRNNR